MKKIESKFVIRTKKTLELDENELLQLKGGGDVYNTNKANYCGCLYDNSNSVIYNSNTYEGCEGCHCTIPD